METLKISSIQIIHLSIFTILSQIISFCRKMKKTRETTLYYYVEKYLKIFCSILFLSKLKLNVDRFEDI
jgi:hypothetical protein